jgi:excisionase family DNA binding protein
MREEQDEIRKRLDALETKIDLLLQLARNDGNKHPPLSMEQAATYLHLSVSRIYCLISEGQLHPLQRKKYGRILFRPSDLNEYLTQQKNKAA